MAYVKAKITILDKDDNAADTVNVLFNPSDYEIQKANDYSVQRVPGQPAPLLRFRTGKASKLSMNLLFDTYDTPAAEASGDVAAKSSKQSISHAEPTDVTLLTRKITGLLKIKGDEHAPPKIRFEWGKLSFTGVILSVREQFTMFTSDGMPVRAKLDLTFSEVVDAEQASKQTSLESPDRTKRRIIQQGRQLWHLAWEEYGDPGKWRVIAEANDLQDPLDIRPGQVLKIPPL